MKISAAGKSDTGRTRTNNEDSFLVNDGLRLYAVADGVGGHKGGEVASSMAVDVLREVISDHLSEKENTPSWGRSPETDPVAAALMNGFKLGNTRVRETGSRDARLSGMGSTMTALLFKGKAAHLAHIGDSRCYLLRGGILEQVTEDHALVAEQVRAGLIRPDQAKKSPYRHIITRAIGIDADLVVDHRKIESMPGDLFLLCTDGLTEMVEDAEIRRILAHAAPASVAEELINAANVRGGVDNITVVVIKIEGL